MSPYQRTILRTVLVDCPYIKHHQRLCTFVTTVRDQLLLKAIAEVYGTVPARGCRYDKFWHALFAFVYDADPTVGNDPRWDPLLIHGGPLLRKFENRSVPGDKP